ncbi:aromatic amino acid transport family protein [Deinococcus radiophilus]|uniref:Amino acid permease n=1 Tax=Deinococcus radiophilus TaxID=32062 RepID=A0A3S0K9U4_9DEIO|nr:aromatic amino acid transport family protein [Deinococcus radiophilus]RTR25924.1 hypothetical protein EJ104_09470 [Deinococcus radiophilus]UFA49717.1 hypothetical protein LMT64_07390 [Deinococcus radiophilus]
MTTRPTTSLLRDDRTWGSTFIIAGTTIGAGMLAMPLTSAGLGFGLTALALINMWALSAYTALQFAEIYRHHSASDGLASLTSHYFGAAGKWSVTAVLLLFMYAISAAYISAGGGLVSGVSPLAEAGGSVLYALAVAAVVLLGAVSVDRLTRVLFAVMVLVFALLMALLLPQMAPDRLSTGPVTPGLYFSALPVLFTAFGFHAVR